MIEKTNSEHRFTRLQRGVSMVEVLIVLGIVGILASLALPSFSEMFARSRLRATAEQIRADVNLARTESQKRNRPIVMEFTVNANGSWCYGLTTANTCNCTVTDATNANFCFIDRDAGGTAISTTVNSSNYRGVVFSGTPFTDNRIAFRPVRPVLESSSVTLVSEQVDASMRIVAGGMGRVRFCSPNGSLSGYSPC